RRMQPGPCRRARCERRGSRRGRPRGGADAIVRVEADAVAVGREYEEAVERALEVGELCKEAVVQEAVGDEGEAAVDAADAVRDDRCARRRRSAGAVHQSLESRSEGPSMRTVWHWCRSRLSSASTSALLPRKFAHSA